MIDPNNDIVPTLRMFDGLMMNIAADEIEMLRARVKDLEARAAAHAQPIGEDAANGAIGEREAFRVARDTDKRVALIFESKEAADKWQARAALTTEKVAAEPVAWFTDDSQSDRSATTWDRNVTDRWRAKGWPVHPLYAAPQPAQTQVALTDDARECLADVVSHYRALYAGLAFQLNEATVTENADDMAYWKHEIKALERMYAQAERALLAAQPVKGGKL